LRLKFYKYQGTGNDFIIIDDRKAVFPEGDQKLIEKFCNRRFGIGADGLILLQNNNDFDFYMKYFNSDGRESSMCGNGGRCIAQFAFDLKIVEAKTSFLAIDGPHKVEFLANEIVSLQMQNVFSIERRASNIFVLNTGSPHYIIFVGNDLQELNLIAEAHKIRYSKEFDKEGININFVQAKTEDSILIRTYERGVEAETLSCGTGSTAAALAFSVFSNSNNFSQNIEVITMGGPLNVTFEKDKNGFNNIYLNGPAIKVFEGDFEI